MLGAVDQENVERAGDEAHDVAILGDELLQGLERIAVISEERANQLQAAWSGGQRLRTDFR